MTVKSLCGLTCHAQSGYFAVLWHLRSIRRSVSDSVFHSLVVSLQVMPRLDYGNATLAGLPASHATSWTSVGAATRLIHRSSRYDYTSHRCAGTFTDCGLQNASISSWPGSSTDVCVACMAPQYHSVRLHSACQRLQSPPSSVVLILAASSPT